MTQQEKDQLNIKTVEQARPIWKFKEYFEELGSVPSVTFLICQKNTKQVTQLCIESILRFYPDAHIFVVDDNSDDDSVAYLQYTEMMYPNIKVWFRKGENWGHGKQMDYAIKKFIKTEYVMVCDSDILMERGGSVEAMLKRFDENKRLYAIGALQISSYKNNGGEPENIDDIVLYGNPQYCLYHRPTYLELDAPFITDGTPCILNNKAAKDSGLEIEYFPIDKYVSHAGASSWSEPRTVWIHDHDVRLRPFLTIIIPQNVQLNIPQDDPDFDLVMVGEIMKGTYTFGDGREPFELNSEVFPIRFNVTGEYVLDCSRSWALKLRPDFVSELKRQVVANNLPLDVTIEGHKCIRRMQWQQDVR